MNFELLKKYRQNKLSVDERAHIAQLRAEQSETELLLDIVDSCQKKKHIRKNHLKHSLSDDQIEVLMIRLLTHNIQKKDAELFLSGLENSDFYDKVLNVLHIASTPESNFAEEAPEIRIQTDEEIFHTIASHSSHSPRPARTAFQWVNKFANSPSLAWRWIGIPVTVVAALAVFMLSPLKLLTPQNTLHVKYFKHADYAVRLQNASRSVLSGTRSSATQDTLVSKYREAFSSYLKKDYKNALNQFSALEHDIYTLPDSEKNSYLQSEFDFYIGLCHLKLAGSRGQHKAHLEKAVHYLSHSQEMAELNDFHHKKEVPFFLALAYQMLGEQDQADQIVVEEPIDDLYKSDAEKLKSK